MRRTGRREGPAGATALLSVQAARNSRSFARALLEGEEDRGGLSPSLSLHEASELVILSAAGAKDLLAHRCEGPADGKDPQARRPCFRWRRGGTEGSSLVRGRARVQADTPRGFERK